MTEIQADYNFIMAAIDFAQTTLQISCCANMIRQFEVTYNETPMAECLWELQKAKGDYLEGIISPAPASPPAPLRTERGDIKRGNEAPIFILHKDGTATRTDGKTK